MKNPFLFTLILTLFSVHTAIAKSQESGVKSISQANSNSGQPKIGGWYPVFFDTYEQAKINSIVSTIKENNVRRIVVLYDKNSTLAEQIISSIQAKVNFAVERSQDVPRDTATTKYNHTQVVVTVFLKDSNGKN